MKTTPVFTITNPAIAQDKPGIYTDGVSAYYVAYPLTLPVYMGPDSFLNAQETVAAPAQPSGISEDFALRMLAIARRPSEAKGLLAKLADLGDN